MIRIFYRLHSIGSRAAEQLIQVNCGKSHGFLVSLNFCLHSGSCSWKQNVGVPLYKGLCHVMALGFPQTTNCKQWSFAKFVQTRFASLMAFPSTLPIVEGSCEPRHFEQSNPCLHPENSISVRGSECHWSEEVQSLFIDSVAVAAPLLLHVTDSKWQWRCFPSSPVSRMSSF